MIIGYARFSKEDTSFSITSQIRDIQDYASEQGIKIDHIFTDDNVVGTLMPSERQGMSQLWTLLYNGQVSDIIAVDATRLARKVGVAEHILDQIFYYDSRLHLTTWERSIKDSPKDRNDFYQESVYADIERRKIRQRTMRGRRDKALEGIHIGSGHPPYGYGKEGSKKNTKLFVIEDEANIIRLIYDLFVNDGVKIKEIVDALNAKNVPSPATSRGMWNSNKWTHDSVLRILRDPRVTGVFYAFKYMVNKDGKEVLRNKDEQIRQYFPELAIIDADLFSAAQDIINNRTHRYTFLTKHEYLFNKRLWCVCNHKIGVQTMTRNDNVNQYYRCQHKRKNGDTDCPVPYLDSKKLDFDAWMKIEAFIRNPLIVLEELQAAQQAQTEEHREAIMTIEALERVRKEHTQKLSRLYDDYQEGLITKEVYKVRKEPIDALLKRAEDLYKEQQQKLDQKVLSDRQIKTVLHGCRTMSDLLDLIGVLDYEDKKKAVELLNITGKFSIKDGFLVLTLYMHNWQFDEVVVFNQQDSNIPLIALDIIIRKIG